MTKAELAILERAFIAEVDGALSKMPRMLQTKSKVAARLADEGFLTRVTERIGRPFPVTIRGYELTHAGRLAYCATCDDDEAGECAAGGRG